MLGETINMVRLEQNKAEEELETDETFWNPYLVYPSRKKRKHGYK